MTKKEEFEEDIEKAIKCAAEEHNFFKDLRSDLRQLKIAVENAFIDSSVKGIKKAFRAAYYLSRAESREQKYLKNVESLLQKLKERMSKQAPIRELEHVVREIDLTVQRLDIEAAHLIRDASRYEGQIRKLLEQLETAVKEHELEKAHQIVMQVNEVVDDAEKWLAALSTDLTTAKKLSHEFEVVFHDSVEGVQEALASLSDEAKGDYVAYLLSSPESIKRSVKSFLEEFVETEGTRNDKFGSAFRVSTRKYDHQTSGMIYSLEGLQEKKTKKQLSQHLLIALKTGNPDTVLRVLRSIPKEYRRFLHAVTKGYETNHVNPVYSQLKSFALRSKSKELILEVAHLYEQDKLFSFDERIASELYAAVGEWDKAAELLGDCKDLNFGIKQAQYYDLAGKFEKAREVRKKIATNIAQYGVEGIFDPDHRVKAKRRKALPLLKQIGMSEKEAFLFLAEQQRYNEDQRAYFYEQAEEWGLAAEVYKRLGNKKKENKYRDKAERLDQKKMGLVEQGDLYFQRKDFEKALEKYKKAEAWKQVGDTLNTLGRGLEAVQAYEKARMAQEHQEQERRHERVEEKVAEATGESSPARQKRAQQDQRQ